DLRRVQPERPYPRDDDVTRLVFVVQRVDQDQPGRGTYHVRAHTPQPDVEEVVEELGRPRRCPRPPRPPRRAAAAEEVVGDHVVAAPREPEGFVAVLVGGHGRGRPW